MTYFLDAAAQFRVAGLLAIIGMALLCYLVAFSWERFCSYGRETLMAAATFILYSGCIGLCYEPLHLLDQPTARLLNGVGGIVGLVGGLQTVYLHWSWHRLKGAGYEHPEEGG